MKRLALTVILLAAVALMARADGRWPGGGGGGGGSVSVIISAYCFQGVIANPDDAQDHPLAALEFDLTVTDINCFVDPEDTGESIAMTAQECDPDGDTCSDIEAEITCGNTNTTETGAIDAPLIEAGNAWRFLFGAPTGTVSHVTYSVCGTT